MMSGMRTSAPFASRANNMMIFRVHLNSYDEACRLLIASHGGRSHSGVITWSRERLPALRPTDRSELD